MILGALSANHCFACGRELPAGLLAEYDDVPFGRLCADCALSPGARYRFLGAVFNAFPADPARIRLAVSGEGDLPPESLRLLRDAVREVVAARLPPEYHNEDTSI